MTWITAIKFDNQDFPKIEKTCSEIADKDKTFDFSISEEKDGKRILKIKSESKNQGYKRGTWIIHKVEVERDGEEVPLEKVGVGYNVYWEG